MLALETRMSCHGTSLVLSGSTTKYPWRDEIDSSEAEYKSEDGSEKGTVPIGSFSANAFGAHDTVGNVAEWA